MGLARVINFEFAFFHHFFNVLLVVARIVFPVVAEYLGVNGEVVNITAITLLRSPTVEGRDFSDCSIGPLEDGADLNQSATRSRYP